MLHGKKPVPVMHSQTPIHTALGPWHADLILNFNVSVLRLGIKRLVHELQEQGNPHRPRLGGAP